MKSYKELLPAYDVSGGDTSFESVEFQGEHYLAIQFYYTSISQADATLRLQESLDGVNWVTSIDSSGSDIERTIANGVSTDILKIYNYNTAYIRLQYIEGTAATGTFDKIKIMME